MHVICNITLATTIPTGFKTRCIPPLTRFLYGIFVYNRKNTFNYDFCESNRRNYVIYHLGLWTSARRVCMYTGIVMLFCKFKTNMYIHLSQISLQIYMYVYIHPTVSNRRAMYSLRKDETPEVVPCVKSVSFATRLKGWSGKKIVKSKLR